ncbi:hypothetical protein CBS9595_003131 [Malassezia furfur]|nr:hypothetical protein CBS9595_003131 [Malassezia furfur]
MYWPSAPARRLCAPTQPTTAGDERGAGAVHIALARDASMWLAVTPSALQVWGVRPSELLAALERTQLSLDEYGANVAAEWRSDTRAIVVHTARDTLLFYDVHVLDESFGYGAEPGAVPPAALFDATFRAEPGEHYCTAPDTPLGARARVRVTFRHALAVAPRIAALTAFDTYVLVGTIEPAAVQLVPWPEVDTLAQPTVLVRDLAFVAEAAPLTCAVYSRAMAMLVWIIAQRAYVVGFDDAWEGTCFWDAEDAAQAPIAAAVNARFSLVALGHADGDVRLFEFQTPHEAPMRVATLALGAALRRDDVRAVPGRVCALAWTPDGHALWVGYEHGWALWSTLGALLVHSFRDDWDTAVRTFRDAFMHGARAAFFGPGGTEMYVLASAPSNDALVHVVPLVRAARTMQAAPDDAGTAVLVENDGVRVFCGDELQDAGLLAHDHDAWRHVPVPPAYLAEHWPLRYAALSSDGRFLAVAGRRGLAHFSCASGRWKTFAQAAQARAFAVRGGLVWFEHVLIAACDADGEIQLRVYARDTELANAHLLDLVKLPSPVVLLSLFDTSLLVYTADNTLYHYLITPTEHHLRLRLCGSISFEGIVGEPARVRALSWLLPPGQQALGDPENDLAVVSLLFLIDAKLVLLRPTRTAADADADVAYDLHILHEQVETYFTNLQGRGPLHNSLWAFDGQSLALWPDVHALVAGDARAPSAVLPLDAYPVCLLLARGVVFAIEGTVSVRRTLDTASFRLHARSVPFLHALLRVYLGREQLDDALDVAARYRTLDYFAHSLELLVHDLLEEEADARPPLPPAQRRLPLALQFLDHFDQALQVVARVARKTEASRWPMLFDAAGPAPELLQACLDEGDADTARHYLLIVHELADEATSVALTAAVLHALESHGAWDAVREVLSFVRSLDDSGARLEASLRAAQPLVADDSPLRLAMPDAPLAPPKRALVAAPRRPTSQPSRREAAEAPLGVPRAHTLHQAARHASLTLSPAAVPARHTNGRIIMTPTHTPRQ